MIDTLTIEGYRAIKTLTLYPKRINLLVGANNSGKSSIISLLCLLSQTLNSSDQSVPLLLRGEKEDGIL